jgi:hypothetical protein
MVNHKQEKVVLMPVDTTNNAELGFLEDTGLTSIIRVIDHYTRLVTDPADSHYGGYEAGWDFPPGRIYLKIRLLKEGVAPIKGTFNHCTNLWILVGKFPFDHTKEVKVKGDDVLDFDSRITSKLVSSVFTESYVARTGISSPADMEQATIASGQDEPVKTAQTSIWVPQAIIDKYDGYLEIGE